MKKIAVFLFFLLSLNIFLRGDFKIMGGFNLSRYHTTPEENLSWEPLWGLAGGFGLEKGLTDFTLLEFNFMFIQKGTSLKVTGASNSSAKYRLNTLSVPVLLRQKFLYSSGPYVTAGLELSSILSHKVKWKRSEKPLDLKDHTRLFDYGLIVGIGWEFKLEEHLFFFSEIRYHQGWRNIFKELEKGNTRKTNSLLLIIGMRS
ncbi:PorT family protein [bacterium]|nr:PorT family protein [bacterium]